MIPPGKAGTTVIMPYLLDYAIPPTSTAAADSGRSKNGVDLIAGGPDLKLTSIIATVDPPSQ